MTTKLVSIAVVAGLALAASNAAGQPLGSWAKKASAICRPDVKVANGKAKLANRAFNRGQYEKAGRLGLQSSRIGQRILRRIRRLPPPDTSTSERRAYLTTQGAQLRKASSGHRALIAGRVGQARARFRAANNFEDRSEIHAHALGIYSACEKG